MRCCGLRQAPSPVDGSFAVSDAALELVEGVDLLIHDSQYTVAEFAKKATWGHCMYEYALWLAGHAKVRQLAMFHHDPNRTDDMLEQPNPVPSRGTGRHTERCKRVALPR